MKRMIALLFAIVMCATSFVSCDRSTESEATDNSSNQNENAVPENAINIGESLLKLGVGAYSHDLRSSAIKEYREKYSPMTFDAFNKVENVYISADFEIASCNVSLISPVDDFNKDFEYNGYIDIALQTVISEKTVTIPVGWWYRAEDWTSEYHIWSYMLKVTDKDGNDHWYYFRINYDKYANYKLIKAENLQTYETFYIVEKRSAELREMFDTREWNAETTAISVKYDYVLHDRGRKINYCSSLGVFEMDGKYITLDDIEKFSMDTYLKMPSFSKSAFVLSGHNTSKTLSCFVSSMTYDEKTGGMLCADGMGAYGAIFYNDRPIPGFIFDGDVSGEIDGEKQGIDLIGTFGKESYHSLFQNPTEEDIKALPKGQYYCVMSKVYHGDYIEEQGMNEQSVYEYLCIIEIN